MAEQALAEALEHLVRGIVDHPERVRVDARDSGRGDVLEVRVHPSDLGRVIGRGGRTASSLRTLVSSLASGDRVRVDVIDTDASRADEADDSGDSGSERDV
ncbi:RNA-binding protein [Leucobacter sp. USHLN153]|uniref:RNA-binding protein n=1 Tax=Leucobacter sp. USHLN153 TaxID=3081268 RepID=UPI003017850A